VGSTRLDVRRADVDDVAADGLGRVEHEGAVLGNLVYTRFFVVCKRDDLRAYLDGVLGLLVDGALIDGLGDGVVDELAQEDARLGGGKERLVLVVDGEDSLEVGIIGQDIVDPVGKGNLLLVRVRVDSARDRLLRGTREEVEAAGLLDDLAKAGVLARAELLDNLVGACDE